MIDQPQGETRLPATLAVYGSALSSTLAEYRVRGDRDGWIPALGRYLYDVSLAETLYPALRWAEIVLRGQLHRVIAESGIGGTPTGRYATWLEASPPVLLPAEQARVAAAIAELRVLDRQLPPSARNRRFDAGRIVSRLGFGFWTRLLDGRYASWRSMRRPIWPRLLPEAFPHCPAPLRTRQHVHARFVALKQMRNRVAHHERIGHLVDDGFHDRCLEAVGWMAPRLAEDLRARHGPRFAALRAEGPRPFVAWARKEAG